MAAKIKSRLCLAGAAFFGCLTLAGGANADTTSWASTATASSSGSGPGADCDPSVQTRQDAITKAKVAGDLGIAKTMITPMQQGQGFFQSSCISNLLSGQGIGILFSPPSLSSIMTALENYVCQEASTLFAQATGPLTSTLGNMSLPLGQAIPGVNLAPALGGLSYSSSFGSGGIGQTGGAGTVGATGKTNLRSILTGTGSPVQIQPYNAQSFGAGSYYMGARPGLFGN